MKRGPTPPVRAWLATLCAALTVVFAGMSAASVVDGVQHAAQTPHEHAAPIAFIAADDDHHADHHADQQNDGDRSDAPNGPQTGPGHHHADAPVGAPGMTSETFVVVSIQEASLADLSAAGAKGIRPGGLERPPKPIAIRV